MSGKRSWKKLSTFQIIIAGFAGVILAGTMLLMLPAAAGQGQWTSLENALFTAVSAVCVTGLVVRDTASYWSWFGQAVILLLIQIGGLGVISITVFLASLSGRRISLMGRAILQDSISAHQIGGIVKMTVFIFRTALFTELLGALIMLPFFCRDYGPSGIWMAVFHSISAFCNAGFDLMGNRTGPFSSLTGYCSQAGIVIPVCLLIIIGGIGFLTWDDISVNTFHIKKYRLQSKTVLSVTALLIVFPSILFFFHDFASFPLKERICLSLFQAVTPRTAGFNTADLSAMTSAGRMLIIVLMLIGGSPGSTAGGFKTTTAAVLSANALSIFQRRKNVRLFGRHIEDQVIKSASTLLLMYLILTLTGGAVISMAEGLDAGICIFETASAAGTVGLSLGITPHLGLLSHLILIFLMFFGRVGGLTLMYAAITRKGTEVSQCPVEKINVG